MVLIKTHINLLSILRMLLFLRLKDLCEFFFLGKIFLTNRFFYLCVSLVLLSSAVFAQNSDIQVTTSATAGGSWSGLVSGTYTFTPSADNANINVLDIQNRLLGSGLSRGNVRIVTTNTTGTQVGNVNIATAITAANQGNPLYTLSIIANGDINVSSAINLASSNGGGSNWSAMNVVLTSSRSINITSPITTSGNTMGYYSVGVAGSITLTATENITSSSAGTLNAVGGFDPYSNNYSRGGDIALSAASVSLNGSINNRGYNSNNQLVNAGNITISTTNTATTTGVNDGQVSGVITGGNFIKSGAGTFILKSVNTYIGTTTVSGGTLQLGAGNALPTSTALTIGGGAVFDLSSFSPTVGSIAGGGTIRSSSGSSTPVLSTGGDGSSTTFSGVIENGSATSVSLLKTGGGILNLSGNSSYTGSTAINAGVIKIQHANALGVSSMTTVANGAALQVEGNIAVGALPLTLKGLGVSSSGGALRNLSGNNTWSGTITTDTPGVRIGSDSGTLTLSGSTAITSATNIGITFGGGGNITVSGAIAIGSAGLTKDGTGILTLSNANTYSGCLLYTSPSPRDRQKSRMPSSA